MANEPEKQAEIESHPLWPILDEVESMRAEAEKAGNSERADILSERITNLTHLIANDAGIPDPGKNDPERVKLESLWNSLREARHS